MQKLKVLTLLFLSMCQAALSYTDGLLPNGDFEVGPKASQIKGTVVTTHDGILNWTISGMVEYIKSGQKQGDMLLVVPEARTCAQEEKLNVYVVPTNEKSDYGIIPIQTMYGSNGWESFTCGFRADYPEGEIVIHNSGVEEDPACGPLIDSVALKVLNPPQRTRANLLKNGNFEEGPYVFPNASWGVLIPPHIEDAHGPLPGWIVESLKAVKYIDSDHFSVPEGKRGIKLVAGKESALAQVVMTIIGKVYVLIFAVGDANNVCEGSMTVEAFAGRDTVQVPYQSMGKGGFKRGKLRFTTTSTHKLTKSPP
ncbi:hypothetical protein KIW84_062307 [Lathyrus oleraceus]|uniref:DUF642 domain-containing protein n=1 Tax=Pisum sativum TaxID=3888 RepID=A0A9D4W6X7_PEA|nr:hypothetical protein KIW84_062307 [Pisum sativum]